MSSIRRVFYYVISLAALSVMAAGIAELLYLVLNLAITADSTRIPQNFAGYRLSLGLAMLVIGAPLWLIFWRSIQKQVGTKTAEIGAAMRQVYLNLILTATAITSLFMASAVLVWLFRGASRFENAAGNLAILIVVVALWLYHWRITAREGSPSPVSQTLRRWYVYIVSAWGLIWLTEGIVQTVYHAAAYLSGGNSVLVRSPFWTENVRTYIAWMILGGAWWGHHWFRLSRGDVDSTLRQVYIYLLGIVGGSVAALVALVLTLQKSISWGLNAAGTRYPDYFQFLGWSLSLMIVALGIVAYHQIVSQEEAGQLQERRLSSRRVHLYILSFLGLGSLVAGGLVLLGLAFNAALSHFSNDWWKSQLAVGVSLLLVGAPLFAFYWKRILALGLKGGLTEWKARSRRIYLYLIIVASILGLVGGLVNLIYQILNAALTVGIDLQTYRHCIISFQAILAAGPLLFYHWKQARAEQKKGAEAGLGPIAITLLAGPASASLLRQLESKLGRKVRFLEVDESGSEAQTWTDEEISGIVREIESSPLPSVIVLVREGEISVLPYREK